MKSAGRAVGEGKRKMAALAAILALALIGVGMWYFLHSPPPDPGKLEEVVIGVPPNEQSALIFIAEHEGFFAKNGLQATIKVYDTALAAVEGVKKGEADIAQSAEFPLVREAFKKTPVSIVASIDKFDHVHLVARKDRGIGNYSDLKGKKIGAVKGTLTEFYLGRFLGLNGLDLKDVTLVYMAFAEAAEALADGRVDAFQVQGKDIPLIKERTDSDKLIFWPSQSGQAGYEVLSGRNDWLAGHEETVKRVLSALAQAEAYGINSPAEAMAVVQKKLNYTDAYMAAVPSKHQYALTLDQSLILAMEDEARWMIKNNLTDAREIPDILDYINEKSLKVVKPHAVNIIRLREGP